MIRLPCGVSVGDKSAHAECHWRTTCDGASHKACRLQCSVRTAAYCQVPVKPRDRVLTSRIWMAWYTMSGSANSAELACLPYSTPMSGMPNARVLVAPHMVTATVSAHMRVCGQGVCGHTLLRCCLVVRCGSVLCSNGSILLSSASCTNTSGTHAGISEWL